MKRDSKRHRLIVQSLARITRGLSYKDDDNNKNNNNNNNDLLVPTFCPSSRPHVTKELLFGDPNYLLRCCSIFDWDRVKACCDLIFAVFTTSVHSEMPSSDAFSLQGRLEERCRMQLVARDDWGNTPLHTACHYKPSHSVIKALLQVASVAPAPGGPIQLLQMANSKNQTPLAVACVNGAPPHIVDQLLHPPGGLLSSGFSVCSPDVFGGTPFWGLLHRYELIRRIPIFSEENLPIEQVMMIPNVSSSSSSSSSSSMTRRPKNGPHFVNFWNSVERMIQAAWMCQEETSHRTAFLRRGKCSMLAGAAHVCDCLPPKITDLILRVYHPIHMSSPTTTMNPITTTTITTTTTANDDMNMNMTSLHPLHLAVTTNRIQLQSHIHPQQVYQRTYFIQRLLELDPSAATIPIPGTNGRSPLCQAIASGLHWHIIPSSTIMVEDESEKPLQSQRIRQQQEQ